MKQSNSPIIFTRTTKRDGLFSLPVVTYLLTRSEDGREIGQFSIHRTRAEYVSAGHREDFRIRRNFWGHRWQYEGEVGGLFARIRFGFSTAITFAGDMRFRLKIKRRWRLRPKADNEYNHLATFWRDETPVMVLQNNQRMAFFSSEVYTPMSGTITTALTDERVICGLLLLFQSSLMMRKAAAAAS